MSVVVRRMRSDHLYRRVAVLRALASLLQSGSTFAEAFEEWNEALPEPLDAIARISRRVRLGEGLRTAIDAGSPVLGEDLDTLRATIDLHERVGADPLPMIERSALVIGRRADAAAAGRAASAGAKLSGWMVGGLPLVSLPLLPMAGAPLFDGPGLFLMFFGLVLTAGGMAWIGKLVPVARPSDDPLALFADHLAAAVRAGASVRSALEICSGCASLEVRPCLLRARRRVRLGDEWGSALTATGDRRLAELAVAIERAERLGVSPASAFGAFASARRAAAARDFERELRRAPVLMVLPLVLCVLPAFGLLAILPFLRGITFA